MNSEEQQRVINTDVHKRLKALEAQQFVLAGQIQELFFSLKELKKNEGARE